jgi:hypothetical protein
MDRVVQCPASNMAGRNVTSTTTIVCSNVRQVVVLIDFPMLKNDGTRCRFSHIRTALKANKRPWPYCISLWLVEPAAASGATGRYIDVRRWITREATQAVQRKELEHNHRAATQRDGEVDHDPHGAAAACARPDGRGPHEHLILPCRATDSAECSASFLADTNPMLSLTNEDGEETRGSTHMCVTCGPTITSSAPLPLGIEIHSSLVDRGERRR